MLKLVNIDIEYGDVEESKFGYIYIYIDMYVYMYVYNIYVYIRL